MSYQTLRRAQSRPPIIETLFENQSIKIDRVTVRGQITPRDEFPDEPSYEFIHLIKGHLVLEYQERSGRPNKISLRPSEFAIKSPQERTRADFTSLDEDTVYLKISYVGEPGKYPLFTGAVSRDEVRGASRQRSEEEEEE